MDASPVSASIVYRRAGPSDIPLIRSLAERIWRESYAAMLSPDQIDYMLGWMYDPAKIAAEIDAGVIWELMERGGIASGYLSVTPIEARTAELNKLYLLPALQGQGLGQAMLARAQAHARQWGADTLTLRVNKSNSRALRAYERAGFRRIDSLVADIGGGFVMDDHVLAQSLHTADDPDAPLSHCSLRAQ